MRIELAVAMKVALGRFGAWIYRFFPYSSTGELAGPAPKKLARPLLFAGLCRCGCGLELKSRAPCLSRGPGQDRAGPQLPRKRTLWPRRGQEARPILYDMRAEGHICMAVEVYFARIGCGRLPVPKGGIGDWLDAASRERFATASRFHAGRHWRGVADRGRWA
jgi:hypothetical protein